MHILNVNARIPVPGKVEKLSKIWESLLHLAKYRTFHKKNSYICYNQNDENTFSYIKSGLTGTIQILDNGEEYIKLFIGKECLFHEAYVVAGFCNSFPQHRCFTDVELYHFSGELINNEKFIAEHPFHIFNITWGISIKALAQDMLRDIIAYKTVVSKIANWMLMSAIAQKKQIFTPNITQIELGMLLHIHKSSVNRVIIAMQNNRIIGRFDKKCCEIIELHKLEALASGNLTL